MSQERMLGASLLPWPQCQAKRTVNSARSKARQLFGFHASMTSVVTSSPRHLLVCDRSFRLQLLHLPRGKTASVTETDGGRGKTPQPGLPGCPDLTVTGSSDDQTIRVSSGSEPRPMMIITWIGQKTKPPWPLAANQTVNMQAEPNTTSGAGKNFRTMAADRPLAVAQGQAAGCSARVLSGTWRERDGRYGRVVVMIVRGDRRGMESGAGAAAWTGGCRRPRAR